MGITSLNIVIKIKFDFPFLCHHFDDIAHIININDTQYLAA